MSWIPITSGAFQAMEGSRGHWPAHEKSRRQNGMKSTSYFRNIHPINRHQTA